MNFYLRGNFKSACLRVVLGADAKMAPFCKSILSGLSPVAIGENVTEFVPLIVVQKSELPFLVLRTGKPLTVTGSENTTSTVRYCLPVLISTTLGGAFDSGSQCRSKVHFA